MKLSFDLTDRDLQFFRQALRQSREAVRDAEEQEIIDAVRQVLDDIRGTSPLPDFIATRIPELETMAAMLVDAEWHLPANDRDRLLAMFVYFCDPEDLLADDVPVIGYLDDIIIIELIMRELKHVREAYADFVRFREQLDSGQDSPASQASRRDRLSRRRQQLHQRMQRRGSRDGKSPIW